MSARITSFADLLAPVNEAAFFADIHDRRPLHIPAPAADKFAPAMSWAHLNALLNMSAIWSTNTFAMVLDRKPVPPDQFTIATEDRDKRPSRQPDAAKVKALLRRGAAIVLNDIETLTPGIAEICNALEARFRGRAQANLYCSWEAHQAFDVHFDTHEVFAAHIEGEKVWRVYEGRVDHPIAHPAYKQLPREYHEKHRGKVLLEVTLRPGDLLYIPRGQYHDALASAPGSVHIAFGLTHVIGFDVMQIVFERAMQDPLFRHNLPLPEHGRAAVAAHLRALGDRLAAIAADEAVTEAVGAFRAGFGAARGGFDLPGDALRHVYEVTATDLMVARLDGRAVLRSAKGAVPIPPAFEAAVSWVAGRRHFSAEEFAAAFPALGHAGCGKLLADLAAMKVIAAA